MQMLPLKMLHEGFYSSKQDLVDIDWLLELSLLPTDDQSGMRLLHKEENGRDYSQPDLTSSPVLLECRGTRYYAPVISSDVSGSRTLSIVKNANSLSSSFCNSSFGARASVS